MRSTYIKNMYPFKMSYKSIIISLAVHYNFEICYRKCSQMGDADAKSMLLLEEPAEVDQDYLNYFSARTDIPLEAKKNALTTASRI